MAILTPIPKRLMTKSGPKTMSIMNTTYADVTDATENFSRQLFANDDPLPVAQLRIREAIALAAVKAW